MPRTSKPIGSSKTTGLILVLVAVTLLWLLAPFHAPPSQPDRIPFSHDAIDEQVTYLFRAIIVLTIFKLL